MANKIKREIHKIDASGKFLGRLATEVAIILRGKHKVDFTPNIDNGDIVEIGNITKMKFSGKKIEQKVYYSHSGYPGGLKEKKLRDLFAKNPGEVLKKAVWNMLPKNKLRKEMIKRLRVN